MLKFWCETYWLQIGLLYLLFASSLYCPIPFPLCSCNYVHLINSFTFSLSLSLSLFLSTPLHYTECFGPCSKRVKGWLPLVVLRVLSSVAKCLLTVAARSTLPCRGENHDYLDLGWWRRRGLFLTTSYRTPCVTLKSRVHSLHSFRDLSAKTQDRCRSKNRWESVHRMWASLYEKFTNLDIFSTHASQGWAPKWRCLFHSIHKFADLGWFPSTTLRCATSWGGR